MAWLRNRRVQSTAATRREDNEDAGALDNVRLIVRVVVVVAIVVAAVVATATGAFPNAPQF